jgi:hypothetical protein
LRFAGLLLIVVIVPASIEVSAQTPVDADRLTISPVGDVLHIKGRQFQFIQGEAVGRLKDGHPVRFDFELTVLTKPDGSALTRDRQSFNLSYDLWEERFAVTRAGNPARSISHLTLADAEAWCLEQLVLPLDILRNMLAGRPFWLRLDYRVQDPDDASSQDADTTLTLRRIIDMLSRRRKAGQAGDSVTAGPFRLPN